MVWTSSTRSDGCRRGRARGHDEPVARPPLVAPRTRLAPRDVVPREHRRAGRLEPLGQRRRDQTRRVEPAGPPPSPLRRHGHDGDRRQRRQHRRELHRHQPRGRQRAAELQRLDQRPRPALVRHRGVRRVERRARRRADAPPVARQRTPRAAPPAQPRQRARAGDAEQLRRPAHRRPADQAQRRRDDGEELGEVGHRARTFGQIACRVSRDRSRMCARSVTRGAAQPATTRPASSAHASAAVHAGEPDGRVGGRRERPALVCDRRPRRQDGRPRGIGAGRSALPWSRQPAARSSRTHSHLPRRG